MMIVITLQNVIVFLSPEVSFTIDMMADPPMYYAVFGMTSQRMRDYAPDVSFRWIIIIYVFICLFIYLCFL